MRNHFPGAHVTYVAINTACRLGKIYAARFEKEKRPVPGGGTGRDLRYSRSAPGGKPVPEAASSVRRGALPNTG